MVLATFAVSITYVAGLSTPGGFWDSTDARHRPGDSILKDRHSNRLRAFFVGNTTAFAASLQIVVVLLDRKLVFNKAYAIITVALAGLVVAYVAGSCRETDTTVYLVILVAASTAFQMALFIIHLRSKKKLALGVAIQSVVAIGRLQRLRVVARRTKKSSNDRYIQTSSTANHWHTNIPDCIFLRKGG
jgi:hypothetical protein